MILTRPQSELLYQPVQANGCHLALVNNNMLLKLMPWIQWELPKIRRNFGSESDLPVQIPQDQPLFQEAPIAYGGIPVTAWSNTFYRQQAEWQIVKESIAYLQEPDEGLAAQYENPAATNFLTHIEQMARRLVVNILEITGLPGPNVVGGIAANLLGFINVPSLQAQGYNAAVLAQQTVVLGGPLWPIGALTTLLDEAIARIYPDNSNCIIIMPQACLSAYKQAYLDRGTFAPMEWLDGTTGMPIADPQRGSGVSTLTYSGIPICVIPNALYNAAGHATTNGPGLNNYDIYILKLATNLFDGCHIGFLGDPNPEATPNTMAGDNLPMGTGISITRNGKPQGLTGIVDAYSRQIDARWQFVVGQPQAAAILTGVTD
jgi:hypothetical protein